jgi:hypothetical protein
LNERGKMSVFQQNLPIQILPNSNNPEGTKYQGLLDAMESTAMKIKMDSTFFQTDISGSISVEFSMSNYNFQFDSSILSKGNNSIISIEKPKVIHKSQIRKTQRLRTNIPFNFTLWTEGGRFDAFITDISTVGIKIRTTKQLHKNLLLSLNVYIPGGSLRFICQGLVMWCKQEEDNELTFLAGIKFTTLSIDSMKKVDKFIRDNSNKNNT